MLVQAFTTHTRTIGSELTQFDADAYTRSKKAHFYAIHFHKALTLFCLHHRDIRIFLT